MMIKHTWNTWMVLLTAAISMSSCLKSEDELVSSPECAIVSFSVKDITSPVLTKKYDNHGNARDTLVYRSISSNDIYFNIDHLNGHIYTVDSLPKWTKLSAVIPSFVSYGDVYRKIAGTEDLYYLITSGSDSLNFDDTVELLCVAKDGRSSRTYTVDINRHKSDIDTLEWEKNTIDLAVRQLSKTFCIDKTIFAFAENEGGQHVVTTAQSDNAKTWSTPVTIPVDGASVVLFGDRFYGLGADGYIYSAATDQTDGTWEQASNRSVERLLAADAHYLYAVFDNAINGTSDLTNWTEQGHDDLDMLPNAPVNSMAYAANTNHDLQTAVMVGVSDSNSKNGVVWHKISSTAPQTNQSWAYIEVTADNSFALPHLDHLSMTRYDGALFAIGVAEGTYQYLYRSDDHGITWHPLTEKYPVPQDLKADNGTASIVAVGQQLWIIQENGTVWQGSIR